jgi:hypothetical protein
MEDSMRTQLTLALLATTLACPVFAMPAQAQRARVFVSVNGNDANPCTAGSPCKTFQAAHDAVLAGGEISVLSTGGYGTLIITKALSIVVPAGVEAAIAIPSQGIGITMNAGSTDKVSLRGLTLDGQGVGGAGIRFNSGASLTVADCVVRNMEGDGLEVVSTATTPQSLAVSNSFFNDNAGTGIAIEPHSSGSITASVDQTGLYNNAATGLNVVGTFGTGTGTISVAVTDNVVANNGGGIVAQTNTTPTTIMVRNSTIANNTVDGFFSNGTNALIRVTHSMITGNLFSAEVGSGGGILSYGDNSIDGNGTNNLPFTTSLH